MSDLDYSNMTIGQLNHRARAGDPRAIETQAENAAELAEIMQPIVRFAQDPVGSLNIPDPSPNLDGLVEELGREKEAKERAAVEREEAMLREMAAMRAAAEQGERRQAFMVRLTVAGVVIGGVGAVAALIAIFA